MSETALPAMGKPVDRADGRLKVTGKATYAAEYDAPGLLHAVLVQSTIARGKIAGIDTAAAEQAPGVVAVLTHRSGVKLNRVPPNPRSGTSQSPGTEFQLQDDRVRHFGQNVAVVLADTLDRVRQRLSERKGVEEAGRLKEALAEHAPEAAEAIVDGAADEGPAANRYEKLINIKDRGQIFRVDVDSIERIDAAGDYMCIYTGDNTLILRETMKFLEKRLDPRRFQRVHRSTIVNLDLVRQVKPHTNGECFLVLESGAQVKVSRSYKDVVARFVH